MYYIAICDDNSDYLEIMKKTLETNSEYDPNMVCHKFTNGRELLYSEIKKYNLIILDMQMEQINGFDLAKQIRQKNSEAVLAFCSGVIMPKPEHFEVQPYRYLLKKIDTQKMQETISDLLIEMKRKKKNNIIEIVSDGKACRVNPKDIVYIYRLNRGSAFVIEQCNEKNDITYTEIQSNEKLADWYQQLADEGFEFAHTSYIVNMQKIISVTKGDILMSNNETLTITRTCKQKFHERFSYYFSKKYRRDTDK